MHKYIAFLRAINVGGRIVKMDALRKIFSDMGFTSVETFIASGNVIFEASESDLQAMVGLADMTALESWIGNHLHEALVTRSKPSCVRRPAWKRLLATGLLRPMAWLTPPIRCISASCTPTAPMRSRRCLNREFTQPAPNP